MNEIVVSENNKNQQWFNKITTNDENKIHDILQTNLNNFWYTTLCDLFRMSLITHNKYHFRMEKNYQNILLYYLRLLNNYHFTDEIVVPLYFQRAEWEPGPPIQLSGNQSSRYDLWDYNKSIIMELKFCPSGLKDKEREQLKIYMQQRRMFHSNWEKTLGFLINFSNNFEFELYFYKNDKLQMITITNLLLEQHKPRLHRPYIEINKIC